MDNIYSIITEFEEYFKDIGGPGVGPAEYAGVVKKYYPEATESVLRLSVAAILEDYPLYIPISEEYHPPLPELYGGIMDYYDLSPKETEIVMGTFNEIADDALSAILNKQ